MLTVGSLIWESHPTGGWTHTDIAELPDGRVVFADPSSDHLVFVNLAAGSSELVPFSGMESHGIAAIRDGFRDALWIADPGFKHTVRNNRSHELLANGQVLLLGVDGERLLKLPAPVPGWRPTAIALHDPDAGLGSPVWIADGYGSNLVHLLTSAGRVLTTVDGSETGTSFSTPHALLIDTRSPERHLVVADRGNRRLVHILRDGSLHHVTESNILTEPSGLAVLGDSLLISQIDGTVALLKPNGTVSLVMSEGANAPHGLLVTQSGRIFMTEWSVDGRALELLPAFPTHEIRDGALATADDLGNSFGEHSIEASS